MPPYGIQISLNGGSAAAAAKKYFEGHAERLRDEDSLTSLEVIDRLVKMRAVRGGRYLYESALVSKMKALGVQELSFRVEVPRLPDGGGEVQYITMSRNPARAVTFSGGLDIDMRGYVRFDRPGPRPISFKELEGISWTRGAINGDPNSPALMEVRAFFFKIRTCLDNVWYGAKKQVVADLRSRIEEKDIEDWKAVEDCKQTGVMVELTFKATELVGRVNALNTSLQRVGNGLTATEADKLFMAADKAFESLKNHYHYKRKQLFPKKKVRAATTLETILNKKKKKEEKAEAAASSSPPGGGKTRKRARAGTSSASSSGAAPKETK